MKNKIKVTLILVVLLLVFVMGNITTSNAFSISKASLYSKGDAGDLLKYNGALLYSTVVVYQKDGTEYPAYCIQSYLPGVGESGSYTVRIDSFLSNVMVWRAIVNGYPYKTPSQLGCNTVGEAFTATKQAVYCMLYGNDANNFAGYEAVGEAGKRTLNALKTIVRNAKNSVEVPESPDITITEQSDWKVDETYPKYLAKNYSISSYLMEGKYTISLSGNMPQGTFITDMEGNRTNQLQQTEKFKILVPIAANVEDTSFQVKVTADLKTKPVFYGKAPSSHLQDYAIVGGMIEPGSGTKTVSIGKNSTKLVICKQEKDTLKPIQGVSFEILDENQKIVYGNLKTDANGFIEISNCLPGTYYIREVQAPEGYVPLEGLNKVQLTYGKALTFLAYNSKEKKTEIKTDEETIAVSRQGEVIQISNKESSTNINTNTSLQEITNQNKQININKQENNMTSNQSASNTNVNVNTNGLNHMNQQDNTNININDNQITSNQNLSNHNFNINRNDVAISQNQENSNSNNNIHSLQQTILENHNRIKLPKTGY